MRKLKKLALAASAIAAIALVGTALAAQTTQPLTFAQPATQYLQPVDVLRVGLDISAAAPAENPPGGAVTISVATESFGVCSVADNGPANFSVDVFDYGDCTVTAHRAGVLGANGHPARAITRTFKVIPDEPTTTGVLAESLNGFPIIISVEGKDRFECDQLFDIDGDPALEAPGDPGFVLRSFPTKGTVTPFTNLICIDDGNGGSVFQAQTTYTPLAGAKGEDSFLFAARNGFDTRPAHEARYDRSPATATVKLTPPVSVPGAPTITSVSPKGGSVTVIFAAPASDGNSPILGYSVVLSGGDQILGAIAPATETFAVIGGLDGGQTYSVTVSARNAAGSSLPSAPVFVTVDDEPETASYSLLFQWNLVSWAGADSIPVSDALAGLGANEAGNDIRGSVAAVYGWNGATQSWQAFFPAGVNVPGANNLHVLSKGQPYWLAVTSNVGWEVQVD